MSRVAPHRLDPTLYPLKVRILARYADGAARLPENYRQRLETWRLDEGGPAT